MPEPRVHTDQFSLLSPNQGPLLAGCRRWQVAPRSGPSHLVQVQFSNTLNCMGSDKTKLNNEANYVRWCFLVILCTAKRCFPVIG